MTAILLTLNRPNLNNRTYLSKDIQQAIDECQHHIDGMRMFITKSMHQQVDVVLEDVCGLVTKLEIDDNGNGNFLLGDVEPLGNNFGLILAKTIRPSMIGNIDEHGIVHNVKILSFFLTDDPA